MQTSKATILVIPCYNEEHRLPLAEFRHFFRQSRDTYILFVNDGSRDGTHQVLDELAANYPQACATLHLASNVGKAEAVRLGFQQAFQAMPQTVGYWDADLATPFMELDMLHAALQRNPDLQLVMGSRVRMLGRVVNRHALRHYFGRIIASAIAYTLDASTYDTQCGAKLFRVTGRVRRVFAQPFLTRWLFDVEILARFSRDSRVGGLPGLDQIACEYPLHQWTDVPGSKVQSLGLLSRSVPTRYHQKRLFETARYSTRTERTGTTQTSSESSPVEQGSVIVIRILACSRYC